LFIIELAAETRHDRFVTGDDARVRREDGLADVGLVGDGRDFVVQAHFFSEQPDEGRPDFAFAFIAVAFDAFQTLKKLLAGGGFFLEVALCRRRLLSRRAPAGDRLFVRTELRRPSRELVSQDDNGEQQAGKAGKQQPPIKWTPGI